MAHAAHYIAADRPGLLSTTVRTLVVLVLCVFGTCRAFLLAEVFLTRCPFHVHPCLFASRALELVSAQFLSSCSETVLRPSS